MGKSIRIFLILCLTFQAAWYIMLFASLLRSSDTLKRTDFVIFYLAGKISNEISTSQIYNADLQYQERQELVGMHFEQSSVLPFNHPPVMLPLMRLLSLMNVVPAFVLWSVFSLILIGLSLLLMHKILKNHNFEYRYGMLILVSIALFYPLYISVLKGQDSTLLLLGLTIWFYGLDKKNDMFAGLGLSLVTIRPQVAVILAIPFIFRQRKVWWWFMGGSMLLVLYSVGLIGLNGTKAYTRVIIDTAQDSSGAVQSEMFNLLGAALRMFPGVNSSILRMIVWVVFGLAIILLCLMWKTRREIGLREGAIAILVALLTVPHLHYHDLTAMLLPLIVVGIMLVEQKQVPQALPSVLIIVLSTLFLLSDLTDTVRYILTYLVIALNLLFLILPEKFPHYNILVRKYE